MSIAAQLLVAIKNYPTLGSFSIAATPVNMGPVTITNPTSNNANPWTYTSSNTSVATVSGNTLTLVAPGSTTITGTQAQTNRLNKTIITTVFTVQAAVAAVWSMSGTSLQNSRANMAGAGTTNAAIFPGGDISAYKYTDLFNGSSFSTGALMTIANYENCACGSSSSCMSAGGVLSSGANELFNGSTWSSGTSIPSGSTYGSAIGSASAAIVSGGTVGGMHSWNGSSWSTGPAFATTVATNGACGTTSSGLSAGASLSNGSTNCQVFNGSTWNTANSLNGGREYTICGGTDATSAFVAGGRIINTYLSSSEVWNGTAWTTANNMNNERFTHGGAGTNSSSGVVAGGFLNGNSTRTSSAEIFSA